MASSPRDQKALRFEIAGYRLEVQVSQGTS